MSMITARPLGTVAVPIKYRWLMLLVVLLAGLASFAIGYLAFQAKAANPIEPELVTLLRLMALLKLGLVIGAIWLVDWRLRHPCRPRVALGYCLALALMASAPGLIWFMTAILIASGLFHAGLILALAVGFNDDRFAPSR